MRINKKTLATIGLLIFLTLILLVLKILQNKNSPVQPPMAGIPTQTASPTPSFMCIPNESIRTKLPVVTENYTIEYFPVPKKFFVTILNNPFEKYKAEVDEWLSLSGIDPHGSCVFWTSAKGVAPKTQ